MRERQIVNRQQRKLYAMYAIGNMISIVKKYQININLKVESVYEIPKALEIDLSLFFISILKGEIEYVHKP